RREAGNISTNASSSSSAFLSSIRVSGWGTLGNCNSRRGPVCRPIPRSGGVFGQEAAQDLVELGARGVLVVVAVHGKECLGLIGGGEEAFALAEGNHAVRGAVGDENRTPAGAYLVEVVPAPAHQPAGRQPGELLAGHVGQRGEGADQHQG